MTSHDVEIGNLNATRDDIPQDRVKLNKTNQKSDYQSSSVHMINNTIDFPSGEAKLNWKMLMMQFDFKEREEIISGKHYPIFSNTDFIHAKECPLHLRFIHLTMMAVQLLMYFLVATTTKTAKLNLNYTLVVAFLFISAYAISSAIEWLEQILFSLRHSIQVRSPTSIFYALLELGNVVLFFYAVLASTLAQNDAASVAINGVGIISISQLDEQMYRILNFQALSNATETERGVKDKDKIPKNEIDYKESILQETELSQQKENFHRLMRILFVAVLMTLFVLLLILRYIFKYKPGNSSFDDFDDQSPPSNM